MQWYDEIYGIINFLLSYQNISHHIIMIMMMIVSELVWIESYMNPKKFTRGLAALAAWSANISAV